MPSGGGGLQADSAPPAATKARMLKIEPHFLIIRLSPFQLI